MWNVSDDVYHQSQSVAKVYPLCDGVGRWPPVIHLETVETSKDCMGYERERSVAKCARILLVIVRDWSRQGASPSTGLCRWRAAKQDCRCVSFVGLGEPVISDVPRYGIVIRDGPVDVLERLRDGCAGLRVVVVLRDLRGVDVLVVPIVEIVLDRHISWQVELRVERAGAVTTLDRRRGRELVDVGGTGVGPVEAGLDAVALVLDLREGEVDLRDHAGHVETLGVWTEGQLVTGRRSRRCKPSLTADAATTFDLEVGADPVVAVIVAKGERAGECAGDEEGAGDDELGEEHADDV